MRRFAFEEFGLVKIAAHVVSHNPAPASLCSPGQPGVGKELTQRLRFGRLDHVVIEPRFPGAPPVLLLALMGTQINTLIFPILSTTALGFIVAIVACRLLGRLPGYRASDPNRKA